MRKLFVFLLSVVFYGCTCLAQIPPQYVYVDSNCVGTLPDYSYLVVASDNCEVVSIAQIPEPGTYILETTMVEMQALDGAGNPASVFFNVVLLDTIPPSIMLNPDWTGYTDQEIMDMYKHFYGWVQVKGVAYNQEYAGDSVYVEEWDTYLQNDTFKVFYNTIPIPDNISGVNWWEGNTEHMVFVFGDE